MPSIMIQRLLLHYLLYLKAASGAHQGRRFHWGKINTRNVPSRQVSIFDTDNTSLKVTKPTDLQKSRYVSSKHKVILSLNQGMHAVYITDLHRPAPSHWDSARSSVPRA
ncbi:hypothetical protein QBC45DRAFT_405731 [Copromyces sp. CBS 386.78]|nr:hypothetical protein QBC45DRAFT_405731 [Copromyces sp. CBS 386.78]